ncbi:fatty acid desaturase [Anaerotalea alkaliphila]|uniref:Fatty acid desaturase n=1 Tax=Anaerotalea alkaliphila TaxID=2662126 RepID=A0A7X5HVE9_9FIRM|nr:fatty acid desaturase [Anaerotalea alkaliphila]NDL67373.1 fatty acid desaturase [Anaerotalea alkaliphila]
MEKRAWVGELKRYARADWRKSLWQMVNTLVPYLGVNVLMAILVMEGVPLPALLPLALLGAGLLVRTFIIFHDCTHQSFFNSAAANRAVGFLTGVLTYTAYTDWQRCHMIHHGTVANLEKRGVGDIWTMTVEEYRESPWHLRIVYRFFRNPVVLFVISPVVLFVLVNRFPSRVSRKGEKASTLLTDLALLGIVLLAHATIGLGVLAAVQLPIIFFASIFGVWMFYVQHQFEEVYWAGQEGWDHYRAAMEGSSYYRLPLVLHWFTGNIGFHNIHHLNSRIPNYHLRTCLDLIPEGEPVKAIGFRESLRTVGFQLYDPKGGRMVGFGDLGKRDALVHVPKKV